MKNHKDKITQYWVKHAEYDLKTAEAMLKTGRYLYVTFMCQQSIEKIIKAIITTVSQVIPPRIHNLIRLAELAELDKKLNEEQKNLLAELTPFCIETRYADYLEKLSRLTDKKLASEYLKKTKVLFKWLRKET